MQLCVRMTEHSKEFEVKGGSLTVSRAKIRPIRYNVYLLT